MGIIVGLKSSFMMKSDRPRWRRWIIVLMALHEERTEWFFYSSSRWWICDALGLHYVLVCWFVSDFRRKTGLLKYFFSLDVGLLPVAADIFGE